VSNDNYYYSTYKPAYTKEVLRPLKRCKKILGMSLQNLYQDMICRSSQSAMCQTLQQWHHQQVPGSSCQLTEQTRQPAPLAEPVIMKQQKNTDYLQTSHG